MKSLKTLAALLLASSALAAFAEPYSIGEITLTDAHALATVPGQSMGGVFMTIQNKGPADALVSVSAAVSPHLALHSMVMDGGVMHMREIDHIDIPGGATVRLQQNGPVHIMVEGLKAPLLAGQSFPMKLTFRKAGEVTVDVHIEALNAAHGAQ